MIIRDWNCNKSIDSLMISNGQRNRYCSFIKFEKGPGNGNGKGSRNGNGSYQVYFILVQYGCECFFASFTYRARAIPRAMPSHW